MSDGALSQDLQRRMAQAYRLAGIQRMSELRERALSLLLCRGKPFEWEMFRALEGESGQRQGVWLTVPVWLPERATEVATYGAPVERWQSIQPQHRFAGVVYHPPPLSYINDKRNYRAGTLTFETARDHAPFAYLLFDAIFREGQRDPNRRVPILSVRSGEDTYAADPRPRSGSIPCFDFKHPDGRDLERVYRMVSYQNLAEIYHGHHAPQSNHRLGCALDINDITCEECKDGSPNPISRAGRQFQRDRMHALDARHLPYWVYGLAEQIGYRVPYQWHYGSGYTDWQHLDCGNLDAGQWERLQQQIAGN
jgi:hypothetical protein